MGWFCLINRKRGAPNRAVVVAGLERLGLNSFSPRSCQRESVGRVNGRTRGRRGSISRVVHRCTRGGTKQLHGYFL